MAWPLAERTQASKAKTQSDKITYSFLVSERHEAWSDGTTCACDKKDIGRKKQAERKGNNRRKTLTLCVRSTLIKHCIDEGECSAWCTPIAREDAERVSRRRKTLCQRLALQFVNKQSVLLTASNFSLFYSRDADPSEIVLAEERQAWQRKLAGR